MTTWNLSGTKHHILICNGGSCMRKLGEEVTLAIRDEIKRSGVDMQVHTTRTRCNGRCEDACVVILYPSGNWYKNMTPEAGRQLVRDVVKDDGRPIEERIMYSYHYGFQPNANTIHGIGKTTSV
ncbi:ferredoxin [Paenibacillus tarimensis]